MQRLCLGRFALIHLCFPQKARGEETQTHQTSALTHQSAAQARDAVGEARFARGEAPAQESLAGGAEGRARREPEADFTYEPLAEIQSVRDAFDLEKCIH